MKTILKGITGSTAYGLDTDQSDIDMHGVFVYPTSKILSLNKGKETLVHTDPDWQIHEVEKFMRLASRCNPTILEVLFLEDYLILEEEGKMLVDNRHLFINRTVYDSYGGYAISQANKLYRKAQAGAPHTRHEKHARHCFRLLQQGKELLTTGKLTVKVSNRDELFGLSKMEVDDMINKFEEEYQEFKKLKSNLPEKPDYEKLNEILLTIRRMNYD